MPEHISQIFTNYEQSFKEYKDLITTNYNIDSYPPTQAENQTFGEDFPGALIRKPRYDNCTFIQSKFDASDGALSRIHNCKFIDCILNNCDFRYCDVFSTNFIKNNKKIQIISCNFSYGNFINSMFNDVFFEGCSFRQMQLENTSFKNCVMKYSSIEQSSIKNCIFENFDFRNVGVRYCTFENVDFNNVTFHILDLPRNYGLIQLLQRVSERVQIAYGNEKETSITDALFRLRKLIPYYLETEQFYELINLYYCFNQEDAIFDLLPYAFKSVIKSCDFAALQDLCALIVKFKICTDQQLRKFYGTIRQLIIPDSFPHYLKKSYNSYIENIKYILVDNPYEYPQAQVLLKTDIETLSDVDMFLLLKAIEVNINELAPNVDASLELTRHSPYDIIIILCGLLPEILTVCQIFYYALGGTKAFFELKNSLKEKTDNCFRKNITNNDEKNVESIKHIELSVGSIFSFKFEKEYTKRVKSMEYTIR